MTITTPDLPDLTADQWTGIVWLASALPAFVIGARLVYGKIRNGKEYPLKEMEEVDTVVAGVAGVASLTVAPLVLGLYLLRRPVWAVMRRVLWRMP